MGNELKNLNIYELKDEIDNIDNELVRQRRIYKYGDKYEQARAQRNISSLKSKREAFKKAYDKKQKHYKSHRIPLTNREISMHEIYKGSEQYYGMSFKTAARKLACGTLAVAGVVAVVYGTMWVSYSQYLNDKKEKNYLNKNNNSQTEGLNNNSGFKSFWETTEGREIKKYSATYGVDENVAKQLYLNRDNLYKENYCKAYNISMGKYDDIFITSHDHTQLTKGVCAQLAQALECCDGNIITALTICEKGLKSMGNLIIKTGINIDSYKETVKSSDFNTPFVRQILSECPNAIKNYYYVDDQIAIKIIDLSKGEETKTILNDDLNDVKKK